MPAVKARLHLGQTLDLLHHLSWRIQGDPEARGASYAGRVIRAVAVRVLGQVLLMVVLGEIELGGLHDLGRDRSVAGVGQLGLVSIA